jgi:hypothetical protein
MTWTLSHLELMTHDMPPSIGVFRTLLANAVRSYKREPTRRCGLGYSCIRHIHVLLDRQPVHTLLYSIHYQMAQLVADRKTLVPSDLYTYRKERFTWLASTYFPLRLVHSPHQPFLE